MGSLIIIEPGVFADLFMGRPLIRIVPHHVDFFLFGGSEESLGKGVVCWSSHPGKGPAQYVEFRDMLSKSKVGRLLLREISDEEKLNLDREKKKVC
ncbi:MAG: hypothetical protein A4E65_00492 [Syntrophorhabdus sp. PtaU1.Bin153]|nr:MAG: hypothetical protein A4E65_00492 [Syntrophorhabdus sp. PtaU1.Bin153]